VRRPDWRQKSRSCWPQNPSQMFFDPGSTFGGDMLVTTAFGKVWKNSITVWRDDRCTVCTVIEHSTKYFAEKVHPKTLAQSIRGNYPVTSPFLWRLHLITYAAQVVCVINLRNSSVCVRASASKPVKS
jgi:hypothetical protein